MKRLRTETKFQKMSSLQLSEIQVDLRHNTFNCDPETLLVEQNDGHITKEEFEKLMPEE